MKAREVGIEWKLRPLMAAHGLYSTTDLMPLLQARGVTLSAAQVYRLVTQPPERLNMKVLAAVCDALGCTPNDLIGVTAADRQVPARAVGAAPEAATQPRPARPTRVRLTPPAT